VQGQILAEYEAGAWGYILPDHLHSVRQLVDAAGQVTLAQSYDSFGNLSQGEVGLQGRMLPANFCLLLMQLLFF
jgi:hypothetical protein